MTAPAPYTPIFDDLVRQHGIGIAAVYGAMWRYAQMDAGVCCASHDSIARRLGLDRRSISEYIQTLLDLDLIDDLDPESDIWSSIYQVKEFNTLDR